MAQHFRNVPFPNDNVIVLHTPTKLVNAKATTHVIEIFA